MARPSVMFALAGLTLAIAPCAAYAFWRTGAVRGVRRGLRMLAGAKPTPPKANKLPQKVVFGKIEGEARGAAGDVLMHTATAEDPYFWLRDSERKDPAMLAHLEAENDYADQMLKPLKALKDQVFGEFLAHMKETDERVPYPHGGWYYYSRTVKGLAYDIYCRKKTLDGDEVILLDVNKLAEGKKFCDVAELHPSPSHTIMAYSVDFQGYETYDIYFKNPTTGELLDDVLHDTYDSFVWGADESTIYYWTFDEAHRPYKFWRHILGTPQSEDVNLFTEDDNTFYVGSGKTQNSRFIVVESSSTAPTSEAHYIDLKGVSGAEGHKSAPLVLFQERTRGIQFDLEQWGDQWWIVTNKDKAMNSKIMTCPLGNTTFEHWKDWQPYDPKTRIKAITPFKDHIAVSGRKGGYQQMWIIKPAEDTWYQIDWPEELHSITISTNEEFDTDVVRVTYSSMTTPRQTLDFNMTTQDQKLLKEQPVPHYNRTDYASERIYATAVDGTQIPMSLVYNSKIYPDGIHKVGRLPILLYGYGSYGISLDPDFDYRRLSYLDRGVVYVMAHIRGGEDEGREWYEEQGKFLTKKNTFSDFVSCAEYLVSEGYTNTESICINGRSAGGLLIGASLNLRPDLFKCVITAVPFVDVLNTMSDPSIPLTTGEWEEWGNPNIKEYHYYMKEYSPYDNVRATRYPAMFVTAGLWDSRVAYWEPAKWVAKLRDFKTDDNPIILKVDTAAGHFSASDRYRHMRERALETAFVLDQLSSTELLVPGPPLPDLPPEPKESSRYAIVNM
ncbi:unnamed protein product [Vitrella brassicaformis CCMP3155]|uniref:Prolyl endopeptidase n=1 Tax=Vitrella brassicaformis (strain CCMP3155) TaxID=1169540 RepID=A0A0G4FNZ3_VITBC|nr:unnamed protein product [Vitrella brassicaformis CCMP3155]|eukprot:CEM15915.1 unnamed protein product [Vitrella brassicaformis CCMP3155]